MAEWFGWAGKILDINLTRGTVKVKPLTVAAARDYIGGSALGAKVLFEEVPAGADPLGPDNVIIVANGPLVGTTVPAAGRGVIVTKSPQTGIYLRSNFGGFFAPEMKWAGYDMFIIRGKAPKPTYISIRDDKVELRDASHLWGKDVWVTQDLIREELGDPEVQTLKIGQAGENMSLCSCVLGDLTRAAGRGAAGAVWGAKNLKAIAVRGTRGTAIAHPEELLKLSQELTEKVKKDPLYPVHTDLGTVGWVSDAYVRGKGLDKLLSLNFREYYDRALACFGCPLHCSHFYTVKSGKYQGVYGEGLEGCCVIYGGGQPRVNDIGFLCAYNTLCNKLGMHINNTGHALGWAVQMYKQGIITKEDTEGIELSESNPDGLLEMVEKMAYRKGFGEILNEFPVGAVKKLGRGSDMYVADIKGVPTQGAVGFTLAWTLAYSVAPRGMDHLTGMPPASYHPGGLKLITDDLKRRMGEERYNNPRLFADSEAWVPDPMKARVVVDQEHQFSLHDMTGVCKFIGSMAFYTSGMRVTDFAAFLNATTGRDFSVEDTVRAAEREFLVARAFNAREGIRRIDDYPSALRWHMQKKTPHPLAGHLPYMLESYDQLLDEYYRLRGCDLKTGIPTRARLEKLGLDKVADDLFRRGLL